MDGPLIYLPTTEVETHIARMGGSNNGKRTGSRFRSSLCLMVAFLAGVGLTILLFQRNEINDTLSLSSLLESTASNGHGGHEGKVTNDKESSKNQHQKDHRDDKSKSSGKNKSSNPLIRDDSPRAVTNRIRHYRKAYGYKEAIDRPQEWDKAYQRKRDLCGKDSKSYTTFFGRDATERSRDNEDRTVFESFFPKSLNGQGLFVEVGASDGLARSNTRFFDECLEWEGMLIDSNPAMKRALVSNRKYADKLFYAPSCSLEEEHQKKARTVHVITSMKGRDGKVKETDQQLKVPCGTLSTPLLDIYENRTIDFMSIDARGSEARIVQNADFDQLRVNVLLVDKIYRGCTETQCEQRDTVRKRMTKDFHYILKADLLQRFDVFLHPDFVRQGLSKQFQTVPDSSASIQEEEEEPGASRGRATRERRRLYH